MDHIKKFLAAFPAKLIIASLLIGFFSALTGLALKKITEHYETILSLKASENWIYILLFPFFGLSLIYFLRHYFFRKKENKGIKEVFEVIVSGSKSLPPYKVSSHFINGFITVAFGGTTGIEVSTVVASATIGSMTAKKEKDLGQYKTQLICAGVAAGITALFGSPIAGILFAIEVISRRTDRIFFLANILAVAAASALVYVLSETPLFAIAIPDWNYYAIPWFIVLGILAGMNAVYLTKCVIFIKTLFGKIDLHFYKIIIGSVILSVVLLLLPQLYGDGYKALRLTIDHANGLPLTLSMAVTLTGILIFKPIVTSVTLAAGGDGGVFAPSLITGGFLGFFLAICLNAFFNAEVIPLNFIIIGMAAMLSASIHAPFTALFLVCAIVDDYTLFFPTLVVCLIAKFTSKMIFPYTVYTLLPKPIKITNAD